MAEQVIIYRSQVGMYVDNAIVDGFSSGLFFAIAVGLAVSVAALIAVEHTAPYSVRRKYGTAMNAAIAVLGCAAAYAMYN